MLFAADWARGNLTIQGMAWMHMLENIYGLWNSGGIFPKRNEIRTRAVKACRNTSHFKYLDAKLMLVGSTSWSLPNFFPPQDTARVSTITQLCLRNLSLLRPSPFPKETEDYPNLRQSVQRRKPSLYFLGTAPPTR